MRTKRVVIPLVLIVVLAGGWAYLFGYPEPPVNPAWTLPASQPTKTGGVSVRFSGTSTLLFSDGETAWMVDGWFSRPGPLRTLLGEIEPDLAAIELGLQRNEVERLAAVIPVHSHYDHAMDTPAVAQLTGALVVGSEATANIARGWGLAEDQIRVVEHADRVRYGDFEITFLESRHFQFPDPEMVENLLTQSEIPEPLVPPASAFDYKLGKAWVLHVSHPAGRFMVVGSAGFIPDALEGWPVDALFLGIGGLGSQTPDYRRQFWEETVETVKPERVILIHWDSLTGPLDAPMTGEVRIAGFLSAGSDQTLEFLEMQATAAPDLPLQTLPRFDEVVLFNPPD